MLSLQKNISEANEQLIAKPLFATTVERVLILNEIKFKNKELPQPLRFSGMLAELLSHVSVPLKEYDLIAGRTVDRELTEEEEMIFRDFTHGKDIPSTI